LSGRDETRTRIDQKSREKKRNDTNNLGRTEAEERRRINEELDAVDQRVEGDGERVLLLLPSRSLAVEHGDSRGAEREFGANRAKALFQFRHGPPLSHLLAGKARQQGEGTYRVMTPGLLRKIECSFMLMRT
jgi:hypothetical protein